MFIRLLIPRRLLRLSTDMKIPGIFRQTGNHKKVVQIAETITNNPSYSNVIFREASGVVRHFQEILTGTPRATSHCETVT